jgi:hypothetical protein
MHQVIRVARPSVRLNLEIEQHFSDANGISEKVMRPSEVQEITKALNSLDPADLRVRYDADTFNKLKIYPRGYTWKPEDENSLIERFDEVKVFVAQVAAVGHGMILTIM